MRLLFEFLIVLVAAMDLTVVVALDKTRSVLTRHFDIEVEGAD